MMFGWLEMHPVLSERLAMIQGIQRTILSFVIAWFCLIHVFSGTSQAADAPRNVVVIVVDDMGKTLGAYGDKVARTPRLDELAREGITFDRAFCTTASCSASRSVILTGLHNHANGQYGHEHSYHKFSTKENVQSLPVLLKAGGYRTARIGKFHVAPEEVYAFDEALKGNSRSPVEMADNCRKFIAAGDGDSKKASEPFFLYYCTSDPHRGGGFANELPHKPDRFGNKPTGQPDYPGIKTETFKPADMVVPPFLPDTPECRAELAQYYQAVNRVDQGVGRLIDILKETGQYENTLIIFISDNGIAFPGSKTTLYEPGMCLPAIMRFPQQKERGSRSSAMISWVDLAPSILDFAKVTPKENVKFHGKSFMALADDVKAKGFNEVLASHTFHEITMYYPMRVLREERYKLMWNIAWKLDYPFASDLWESPTWQSVITKQASLYGKRTVEAYLHRAKFELYDLEKDPDEIDNLAEKPEFKDTLLRMQTRLKQLEKQTQDPWILKWDYE